MNRPVNFRPTASLDYVEETSAYFNHEGGDQYLSIQELEHKIKYDFRLYAFWTWVYLIFIIGGLLYMSIELIQQTGYAASLPLYSLIVIYLAIVITGVGVGQAIHARVNRDYGKNKIFIYFLIIADVLLLGLIVDDVVKTFDQGAFDFDDIIWQIVVLVVNMYFIYRAYKIFQIFLEVQRIKQELKNEIYYMSSASAL